MIKDERRRKYLRRLSEQVQEKIISERLYLQPRLTVMEVANRLNASRKDVSYVVNAYVGKSFADYINGLRMDEAVRLIQANKEDRLMIKELTRLAGFNDRTTFCRICKKIKGVSPTELEILITDNKL